jgi:excisionase family DNA binding protein
MDRRAQGQARATLPGASRVKPVTAEPTNGVSAGDRLINVQDVAHRLGVPISWVYAQAEAGTLPSFKVGRYRRFCPREIDRYLEAQRHGKDAAR